MSLAVVCLGETMALIAPDPPRPLATADRLVLSSAGAESNVAMALARLGTSVQWCSRLGDDALGHRIAADLDRAGVGTDLVRFSPTARTGLMLKDPEPHGTSVLYYRDRSAASQMDESDVERALAARPALLHLSGITPALSGSCARAVTSAIERGRDSGIRLSFDVNLRPALWDDLRTAANAIEQLAQRCDIVFVGLDEATMLWPVNTADEVRALIGEPDVLVVKDGAGPATAYDRGDKIAVPALPVEVVEPVGAGDAFAAGWLHGYLSELSPLARLRLAHLVAAGSLASATDHPATAVPAAVLRRLATDTEWPPPEWRPTPILEDR
jgi:2-dehydro-3-deoxygluconokinase